MKIAFFGTGLMGAGFVRRLRANGHELSVWNRSPAKAQALAADGIRACDTPSAALVGAERIHLSLSDDASVDAVLEPKELPKRNGEVQRPVEELGDAAAARRRVRGLALMSRTGRDWI